jgi:hypothetical protein
LGSIKILMMRFYPFASFYFASVIPKTSNIV